MLLQNPYILEFCQRFKGSTLQDVHKSLANQDKFQALIEKYRALCYPYGQDIAAVEYEFRLNHDGKDDAVSIDNMLTTYYEYVNNLS